MLPVEYKKLTSTLVDTQQSGAGQFGKKLGVLSRALLPVGDRFDVHANAGFASVKSDATARTRIGGTRSTSFIARDEPDSTNLTYGVGAAFRLHSRWSLSLDWQQYEVSEDDTNRLDLEAKYDVISLGLIVRLGVMD